MRDLEGKIVVFEPIAVMQLLNLAEATGELRLRQEGTEAFVFFERGNVTYAGITNRPVKLGEYLIRAELVTQQELDRVLKKKRPDTRLGRQLVEAGVIEESELRDVVEEQIKDVIYEIVRWQRGTFLFDRDKKPNEDILIDIPFDHLMLEGLKRLDEEREQS